jgi:hypothetical protein
MLLLGLAAIIEWFVARSIYHRSVVDGWDSSPLSEYALRTNFPIIFDTLTGEYQLSYVESKSAEGEMHVKMPIQFCPWSGEELPKSKRGELFFAPNQREIEQAMSAIRNCRTLRDVKAVLGDPDFEIQPSETVKRQWTYSNRWKTIELMIQENSDDSISVFKVPKSRK